MDCLKNEALSRSPVILRLILLGPKSSEAFGFLLQLLFEAKVERQAHKKWDDVEGKPIDKAGS